MVGLVEDKVYRNYTYCIVGVTSADSVQRIIMENKEEGILAECKKIDKNPNKLTLVFVNKLFSIIWPQ